MIAATKHKTKVTHGKARHVKWAVIAHRPKKHVAKAHQIAHIKHGQLKHRKAKQGVGAKSTL